ncbi:MAG: transporter [Bacteroidetes bacterium]|nr:MAG: transporter [Bacteroidota bacterium]
MRHLSLFRIEHFFYVLGLLPGVLAGQTCCSGGVPVSSNLGLPASEAKTLQLSLNYDLNELKTLREGSRKLDNPGSSRRTHTVMFQAGYAFSGRLSADVFIPYIRQERTSTDFEYSAGLGDISALLKYKILLTAGGLTQWLIGAGVEFPTGSSSEISNLSGRAFLLSADMQPGSGSWDGIFWTQFVHATKFRPSLSFLAQGIYKYNGENRDFDGGKRPYQFGQEFQILAGLSDRILLFNLIIDPNVSLRFRKSYTDHSSPNGNRVKLPASGGNFLMAATGVAWWVRPDFSINVNVEVPIYAEVTLSQVAPTYRLNAGFYYKLGRKAPEIMPAPIFTPDQ